MSLKLKVFQLDDFEWWVGEALDETVAAAKECWGGDPDYEDARELSETELDKFLFYGDENQTFRQRLAVVAKDYVSPVFFAMTES